MSDRTAYYGITWEKKGRRADKEENYYGFAIL